jgi:hypothetical protein
MGKGYAAHRKKPKTAPQLLRAKMTEGEQTPQA